MKVFVTKNKVSLEKDYIINKGEYKVNVLEFEFSEEYTNNLIKKAIFETTEDKIEQVIIDNQCNIPYEVLNVDTFNLRVYAYEVNDDELILRYSPTYVPVYLRLGSYITPTGSGEEITPTQFEQYEQQLNAGLEQAENVNITCSKEGNTATITTTDRNGQQTSVEVYDGQITQEAIEQIADIIINERDIVTKDTNELVYYTLSTETGSAIDLEINSSTYVVTLSLKDKTGNVISTDTIDLPLETMVIGASYDSQTKEIVLTLKNGTSVRFSVADLVSGLQTEITSNSKLSSDLVDDTNNTNKFVTQNEKDKLSGIETGAEVNIIEDVKVNGTSLEVIEKSVNVVIPTKTSDINNDSGFIDKDVNNLTNYIIATNVGTTIELSMNSSTYVVTINLKNNAGTTISTSNIDLPLETMVVNGSYDETNKQIVLTLKNGTEIKFSIANLISGLQSEITSNNKLLSDLIDDTNQTNKFVTSSEKTQITTNATAISNIKDGANIDSFGDVETALNNKVNASLVGANNGIAELDNTGRVPSSQLPSYVDDVIEGYYYNDKFYEEDTHTTEITGQTGKIYIDLVSNKTYRWSGTGYAEISQSLALGETSSTAYRGDRGKTAYDHATDPNKLTTTTSLGLYKIEVTSEGHISSVTAVVKSDLTSLGVEDSSNKVTSISSSSTDTQYPSAKCVYDIIGDIESVLESLDIGGGV